MKNKTLKILSVFIFNFLLIPNVYAVEEVEICKSDALEVFYLIGLIIFILKILVPVIIIVYGFILFFKVLFSGDEKDLSSSITSLFKKLIAGFIIFFIPTIVLFVINFVTNFRNDDVQDSFTICSTCLFAPNSEDCEKSLNCLENSDSSECEGYGSLNDQANSVEN